MSYYLSEYVNPMKRWIRPADDQEPVLLINHQTIKQGQEMLLAFQWLARRRLIGHCLHLLTPGIFRQLGSVSGVFAAQEIPSRILNGEMTFPGDVDVLMIPYSDGHLLVSEAIALEVKIVRASFSNQSKSPNQWGISQASALLVHGFPRAGVLHLILSNGSPETNWREFWVGTVLDEEGRMGPLNPVMADPLQTDLLRRSAGRVRQAIRSHEGLGWLSAHLSYGLGDYLPEGAQAIRNSQTQLRVLQAIELCFNTFPEAFINIPNKPSYPQGACQKSNDPVIVDRRRLMGA